MWQKTYPNKQKYVTKITFIVITTQKIPFVVVLEFLRQ